jgi:UDP-glucose 4-epimerase
MNSTMGDANGKAGSRKRIIVTGGAGYVGRIVTRRLYDDHDVCVIDAMRYGNGRLTASDLQKVRLETIDIRNGDQVRAVVEQFAPDVIIHLAAMHYIPDCERDPQAALETNEVGTVNMLLAAPRGCRFVVASSAAVYRPDEALHSEQTSEIGPSDVYGFTKLHCEHFVRYFAAARSLEAVLIRLFNVVGPGETNPHLIPDIVAQLQAGRTTIRLGNIWPKRDYIHVQDAASGFVAAALADSVVAGEAVPINLGTSHQYSVAEIVAKLGERSGLDITIETDPSRVRPVDRPFLGADNSRAKALLGWSPQFSIDDAIADLWKDSDLPRSLTDRYQPTLQAAAK